MSHFFVVMVEMVVAEVERREGGEREPGKNFFMEVKVLKRGRETLGRGEGAWTEFFFVQLLFWFW